MKRRAEDMALANTPPSAVRCEAGYADVLPALDYSMQPSSSTPTSSMRVMLVCASSMALLAPS